MNSKPDQPPSADDLRLANLLELWMSLAPQGVPLETFLADHCRDEPEVAGRLRALANADEWGRALEWESGDSLHPQLGPSDADSDRPRAPMAIVGPYKLLSKLGGGGQGEVWLAEQRQPVNRRVAIKFIRDTINASGVLARFEQERQALAVMNHPNIAKIFDAGTTDDGTPYFVMELVKGIPITEYCDQERLTPRERLELFISVCQAVQHAHQKGIIHRDLKPGNVLVALDDERPVVKVIDFGLAKATQQKLTERSLFTEVGRIIGTVEYMAPEQAELNNLDIDTRVDIYALGVILYELLTGSLPFGSEELRAAGMIGTLEIIRKKEPRRPSARISDSANISAVAAQRGQEPKSLSKTIQGELDWIVMKCLEKERKRRYESPSALAMDLERYLTDEPVLAGPPSASYQFRKFAKRHRVPLIAAALAVILLTGGIIGTTWGLIQAHTARQQTKNLLRAETKAREDAQQAQSKAETEKNKANLAQSEADKNAHAAQAEADRVNWALYASQLARAHRDFEANDVAAAQHQLDLCRWDFRGLEYSCLRGLLNENQTILRGHTDVVSSVAFSPDGDRIASGSADATIRVWDAKTGQEVLKLSGKMRETSSLAFSPNGSLIASAGISSDYGAPLVVVWDATTGKAIREFSVHRGAAIAVTFSPDGKWIASGDKYSTIKVWAADSGHVLLTIRGVSPSALAFSPDGKWVAAASSSHTIAIWDANTGRKTLTLAGHSGERVSRISFSADGRQIAGCGQDWNVKLWDIATSQPINTLTLEEHQGQATAVAFSPNGKWIAAAGADSTIKVWDAHTGELIDSLKGHTGWVSAVAFSRDENRLLSGGSDHTVRLWDVTRSRKGREGKGKNRDLELLRAGFRPPFTYSLDGDRAVSDAFAATRTFKVWDAFSGALLLTLKGGPASIDDHTLSVRFSPDGKRIATGGSDGTITVSDAMSGKSLITFEGGRGPLAFSADGKWIASAADDGILIVRDTTTGAVYRTVSGTSGDFGTFVFSRDGKRIAAAGDDETVKVWDVAERRQLATFTGHTNWIRAVRFSPDGNRIASRDFDDTLTIWDASSGREIFTIHQTRDDDSFSFSPDGRRLVGGDGDAVKVWDVMTGRELLTLEAAKATVAFSTDGRQIATGTEGGKVQVWDAASGKLLFAIKQLTHGQPNQLAFSPDDGRIIAQCYSDVKVWDIARGQAIVTLGTGTDFGHIDISSDGKRIANECWDPEHPVKVWDPLGRRTAVTLKGCPAIAGTPTFDPEGKWVAVGSSKGTVGIWDATSGDLLLTLNGHTGPVVAVWFNSNGKQLVSQGKDDVIRVWDARSGHETFTLKIPSGGVSNISFSPDSRRFAIGGNDGGARVCDAISGQQVLSLKGEGSGLVWSIAFSPDGERIGVATDENKGTVRLWNLANGKPSATFKEVGGTMAFSPDGEQIAIANKDHTIKVWATRSGQLLVTLKGHTGTVQSVAFGPHGKRIISGSGDGTVRIWETTSGQELLALEGCRDVNDVAFSHDGMRLVSRGADRYGEVKVWDATGAEMTGSLIGHTNSILCVAFSPDGNRIASASKDKTVKVWDPITGQEIFTFDGHTDAVNTLAFSHDGKQIVSGSKDKTVKVWDAGNRRLCLTRPANVAGVAFSSDNKRIAYLDEFNHPEIWDAANGKVLQTIVSAEVPHCLALSPDDKWIAIGEYAGQVRVYDLASAQARLRLNARRGESEIVTSVAFGPHGKRIVAGTEFGKTVFVWDASNGQLCLVLEGHTGAVNSVACSTDGAWIASGSADHSIKVWNANTGDLVRTLRGPTGPVTSVAFNPDSRSIVAGSEDGIVRVWNKGPSGF